MGTCSCDGEAKEGKQVVVESGSMSIQQKPTHSKAHAGADSGDNHASEVPLAFADPPDSVQRSEVVSPYRAQAPALGSGENKYTRQDVVELQSWARIFLQKRAIQRRQTGTLEWSDSEEVDNEDNGEALIDPTTRLSPQARTTLSRHAPLRYSQDIKGVASNSARFLPDGSVYVGQWGVRHNGNWVRKGKGRLYCNDGGYKEGYWKNAKLHHFGRAILPTGDYYEGAYKNGVRDGTGRLESADTRAWYSGEWKRHLRDGQGTEVYQDGTQYEGSFVADQKHGRGRLTYPEGNNYDGDFDRNQMHGKGTFKWHDGRVYVGDWHQGKMHGKGKFRYADGKTYDGDYVNEKKHGYGIYDWDNKKYEGDWHQGKMHGKGWLTNEKGRKQYYFNDGVRGELVKE